jgi:cyclopropane fatty-acyl-phospholipid synthase-like methyltransferase
MHEYDQICDWYVTHRFGQTGIKELERLVDVLQPGAKILDLGCGDGQPLTRFLLDRGFSVYAVDSSSRMVARFRENFAGVPVQCSTIQISDFFHTRFAAVVAWGVFFHLSAADQVLAIAKIAHALEDDGWLLFTSGKESGSREGEMDGVSFSYVSLGREEYCRLLREHGLHVRDEFFDQGENYYYLAQKFG